MVHNHLRYGLLFIGALYAAACSHIPEPIELVEREKAPKQVILMISDGAGFSGWLAGDYYQGLAGRQPYQVVRPDGTEPIVFGVAHSALILADEFGEVLPKGAEGSNARGAIEQGYDPVRRWARFENAMIKDSRHLA